MNVGVAEAQLICTAAGLALEGWSPVAYSIASFATARCFEQTRTSVCYPQLPVVVIGAGGGYTYSTTGVTHHAVDDFALMSVLPGMIVVAPGDPNEVTQLLKHDGPSYLRIGRYGEPTYEAVEAPVLGRARLLRDGEAVGVVSTGDMASEVLKALDVLSSESILPIAYQMHTVKPLDRFALDTLADRVETIIVVEEHVPSGGLGAAVNAWRAAREKGPRIIRLGPPDEFALGSLKRDDLRRRLNFDAAAIETVCHSAWRTASIG